MKYGRSAAVSVALEIENRAKADATQGITQSPLHAR